MELWPVKLNRTRTCTCCKKRSHRVFILSPTPTDPDYAVALCGECDMMLGRVDREV